VKRVPFVDYLAFGEAITLETIASKLDIAVQNGIRQITLESTLLSYLLDHMELYPKVLPLFSSRGIICRCAHGAWREGEEISLPFEGDRKRMLERVAMTLKIASEMGADTCSLHAESWFNPTYDPQPLENWRAYILASLEELLPLAEELSIVIALENIWGPPAMPDELCRIVEHFKSPWLGLCFDAGHANVISASGLRSCGWMFGIWKHYGEVPWRDDTLDVMLPHIVTAHLHDNDSSTDTHDLPGRGTIDWQVVVPKLMGAPRLRSIQSEVTGELGYTRSQVWEAFRNVLPEECFAFKQ